MTDTPATEAIPLESHLSDLHGAERIDALNAAAQHLAAQDPLRGVQFAREAHTLALQLRDDLRAAQSLIQLQALHAPDSGIDDLAAALNALAAARLERDELRRQLREHTLTLQHHAQHDALTGLHNRRFFLESFFIEYARTRRFNYPLSVALFDIDDLGLVNRRYSQKVGDEVLRVVAQLLARYARDRVTLARYNGEEFAALLHGKSVDEADAVCGYLRDVVESHDWGQVQRGLHVTLSYGVADDTSGGGPEGMLATANEHLETAKRLDRLGN